MSQTSNSWAAIAGKPINKKIKLGNFEIGPFSRMCKWALMHHKGGPLPVNDKENNGRLFANINMEPVL
jgi:hypothetical protein